MVDITSCLKSTVCACAARNPKQSITYAWGVSLVLVLVSFIVACIAVAYRGKVEDNSSGGTQAAAFAAIWTALVLIAISILGTIIMRRYQAPLSIGFFLGVLFIVTNQMLILFAIFADHSAKAPAKSILQQADTAMATFSFFLFIVYFGFATMLFTFRGDIIKEDSSLASNADEYAPRDQTDEAL